MSPGQSHWSATENRVIQPYKRADSTLQRVRFRTHPGEEFGTERTWWFDRDRVPVPFSPELDLDVDVEVLADAVEIPLGDLRASVVVRDRAVKRWTVVRSWPLSELPDAFVVPLDEREFALGRRMEFVLMVTPSNDLPVREGRAYRKDQVVAEVAFEASVRKDGSRFNVATMPPEWFEENGLPKDTIWAIDWDSRDPAVEPIAALTVVVNERHAELLQRAFGSEAGADALATQIAIDVFVEASMVAIENAEEFQQEPSTLLGSVLNGLGIDDASDFEALREKVTDDDGRVTALSLIRARAQSRIGLARALDRMERGNRT